MPRLVFSEEFLSVFDEADEDDDGGADEADEEHDLKYMHGEETDLEYSLGHGFDCIRDWRGFPSALLNSGPCAVFPGGCWRLAV